MNSDEYRPRTLPLIVVPGVITAFNAMASDLYSGLSRHRTFSQNKPRHDANISLRVRRRNRYRTTSEEDRNMNSNLPAAAFGHFVLKVDDVDISYQFYAKLGLRPFGIFPELAIIELRGGTHILLFRKNDELASSLSSSHLGQRGASFNERLDLMIDGKSRSDLELYRATLMEKGLSVDAIAIDQFFGHDYFQLVDPDGNGITVYTSHTGELSV
jgi:catechol 2,3-dioxygenase-like lactoylglutathione lyase family enzyme